MFLFFIFYSENFICAIDVSLIDLIQMNTAISKTKCTKHKINTSKLERRKSGDIFNFLGRAFIELF